MASFAITDSSNIIGSVRIMVQEEGLLAPQGWTCWQFPFLFQASLKARSYFYKWAGIGFPVSSMLSSESEESYQTLCLLLSGEAVKYFFFFFFNFERVTLAYPRSSDPYKLHWCGRSLKLHRAHLTLESMLSYQGLRCAYNSLFIQFK